MIIRNEGNERSFIFAKLPKFKLEKIIKFWVPTLYILYVGTLPILCILNVGTVPMLCILNVGTVPMLCVLNVGTVPMLCVLNVGTVPTLCILNVGTVPTFSHSLIIKQLQKRRPGSTNGSD